MRRAPQIAWLPDGRRLHLQDGPIDLVIEAWGPAPDLRRAYRAAARTFDGLLDGLCAELPQLRSPAGPASPALDGPVARRMAAAVSTHATNGFITPMAAVAGAVADHVLAAMAEAGHLTRAYVNNGGDIALLVRPGEKLSVGLVDRPDAPTLFRTLPVRSEDGIGGVATSGWRGRSFSCGIADSVTVLARSAAEADAAATVVANAVDLPGHAAVRRLPADSLQPDSDLGSRLVTRDVAILSPADRDAALASGLACATALIDRGLIRGVALRLQGAVRTAGFAPHAGPDRVPLRSPTPPTDRFAHA